MPMAIWKVLFELHHDTVSTSPLVSNVDSTNMPERSDPMYPTSSMMIFTGMRWTILIKLSVALSGGSSEKSKPLAVPFRTLRHASDAIAVGGSNPLKSKRLWQLCAPKRAGREFRPIVTARTRGHPLKTDHTAYARSARGLGRCSPLRSTSLKRAARPHKTRLSEPVSRCLALRRE